MSPPSSGQSDTQLAAVERLADFIDALCVAVMAELAPRTWWGAAFGRWVQRPLAEGLCARLRGISERIREIAAEVLRAGGPAGSGTGDPGRDREQFRAPAPPPPAIDAAGAAKRSPADPIGGDGGWTPIGAKPTAPAWPARSPRAVTAGDDGIAPAVSIIKPGHHREPTRPGGSSADAPEPPRGVRRAAAADRSVADGSVADGSVADRSVADRSVADRSVSVHGPPGGAFFRGPARWAVLTSISLRIRNFLA